MRSKWKNYYCDPSIQQKILVNNTTTPIPIQHRSSSILPDFVNYQFEVHNGLKYILIQITPEMVGHKFGEFAMTRSYTQKIWKKGKKR